MNYTACIPKNCGHHLSGRLYDLRLLRSWFTRWSLLFWLFLRLGVKWWIHVSSTVMNRCRNSFGLRWNIFKYCFEIVTRSQLSTVSKRDTHLADSFFIPNCSCKIEVTVPYDMSSSFNKLAHFHSSINQKKQSWTLSSVAALIGHPERGASHVEVRFIHPIVYNCKRWCRCYEHPTRLWFLSTLNLSYVWSLHKTRFFPFCKKYKDCSL